MKILFDMHQPLAQNHAGKERLPLYSGRRYLDLSALQPNLGTSEAIVPDMREVKRMDEESGPLQWV